MNAPEENPVLAHARAAHRRAHASFAALRAQLAAIDAGALAADMDCLDHCLEDLLQAGQAQLPARWSGFFVCYDRVLARLRAFEHPAAEG